MKAIVALASATAMCSCALSDSVTVDLGGDENFEYFIDGDMAVPIPLREEVFLASGGTGPSAIFLNFEGPTVHKDGWRQDNSLTDSSFITDVDRVVPAFDAQYWSGSRASVIAEVLQGVRDDFAAYDVLVTDIRPIQGSYTMIIVGGRPSDIGLTGNLLGVAPFDSSNWNPNDVGFVFSDRAGENGYLPRYLAHVISHELAHTVGLNHVTRHGDIMRPSACHCTQSWGVGAIVGNDLLTQDDDALLRVAFPVVEPIPDPVSDAWVGTACSGTDSCDLSHGGVDNGECLSWFDADSDALFGFCSNDCVGTCTDLPGEAPSFCTSVQGTGQCVPSASAENNDCASIAGTQAYAKPRFVGNSGLAVTWANVCLPANEAITCGASGAFGVCIDTVASSCAGTIYTGLCPGPYAIRCCVP